ncbi:MAG: alpha/beta fold hydrolase [Albidovulum sp.]|nr:alpha/beta fold hydrolase [Albidovulum sp.]
MRKLNSSSRPPRSGSANSLVIFLHGYGADGANLLDLAGFLAAFLPDSSFLAPDAPEICRSNPFGFQWFPIPWIDGSSEQELSDSFEASKRDLNEFIDNAIEERNLLPRDVALLGFSQGTMLALSVAPLRPDPVACVVGFSGRLLNGEILQSGKIVRPPVFLAHGDRDELVPPSSLKYSGESLIRAGFEVEMHVSQGFGHEIAPEELKKAGSFMAKRLGSN